MEQQLNSSTGGWIGDDRRDEADFTSVSQTIAKPNVSGSLPFADGFIEGEGYCDAGCKAVVWENDLCMYRNECPIGCGTVWVLPSNDR